MSDPPPRDRDLSDASLDTVIDAYHSALAEIHARFGYKEDWVVLPISDKRDAWWFIDGDVVVFGDEAHPYDARGISDGHCYEHEIYRQRFLKKWVYETDTHTMVCVDTHTDGNKFLQIMSNANRKPVVSK